MYQVLYRKWRPRFFEDVVGQEHVTKTLQKELELGRISHAYLFIGSRGTGKTTCAKILAKAINCPATKNGNPCGECEICRGIDNGSIVDVVELDAASNNGVNDIRTVCEESTFTPAVSKCRVYIIDEVHMLSTGAFNALLKTLEEPPAHVVFILATTEAHKIPATILSRCQKFEFHRISVEDIFKRLSYVAKCEKIQISDDAICSIAQISDGALRDALSLLDKCVNLSDNINVNEINEIAGIVDNKYLFKLLRSIIDRDSCYALKLIDELVFSSKDMMHVCEEFISYLRNLMLVMVTNNAREIITVSDKDFEKFIELSKEISVNKILKVIDAFETALQKMVHGCNKRIQLEMTFVKMCSGQIDVELSDIVKRLERLEAGNVTNNKDVLKKISRENSVEVDAKSVPEDMKSLEKLVQEAKYFTGWPEVLSALKKYSQTISAAFSGSSAYVSGDYILIDAEKEVAFEMLRKSSQREKMREAIKSVTGRFYKLGPYKKSEEKSEDPLDKLVQEVKDAGIDVTVK